METNKIDKIFQKKLQTRVIQPSGSAWERLHDRLDDEIETKKISWLKLVGFAASVLLLISVAIFVNSSKEEQPSRSNSIVVTPAIDVENLVVPVLKEMVPVENAIVTTEIERIDPVNITKKSIDKPVLKSINLQQNLNKKFNSNKQVVAKLTPNDNKIEKKSRQKETNVAQEKSQPFVTIKVDSEALLYAVTHTEEEVRAYYAKYDINRNEVLKTIKNEIKKAKLTIDANTILTSVEKTIDEETFKRSFMQVVKGKITGLASAISNRNK